MVKDKNNKRFFIAWIASLLLLSLAPFYGLGYLIFVIGAARYIRILKAFDSYFANAVLSVLILVSSITIAGIFTSFAHIPNYAVINILFALSFTGVILYFQQENPRSTPKRPVFTWSDTIGIITGIVVPVLIVLIHVSALGVNGALFRIVNADGWDNTSHLNLLQSVEDNNNYFYSSSPIHLEGRDLYNNYPQGWHLASSSIVNGIMPGVFNPNSYGLQATLVAYLSVVFIWYFIACYTLLKLSWSLAPVAKSKFTHGVMFLIAIQFPVLSLFLTSITSGFINYLALMPMLLVIVMLSYQLINEHNRKQLWLYLTVSSLFTTAIGLTWILPVPALGLLILIVVSIVGIRKQDLSYSSLPIIGVIGVCLVSLLLYGILFIKDIGVGQLFVGNGSPEHFPNQWTITICLAFITVSYAVSRKLSEAKAFSAIAAPFVVLVLGVWLLSYLHSGTLGYYSAKTLGLLCVVIFVFTLPAIIWLIEAAYGSNKSYGFVKICTAVSAVGILVLVSGQTIDLRMLQRNQYILSAPERDYASRWIFSDESLKNKGQLLIERDDILAAPSSAMLFNRVSTKSAELFLAAAANKNYDFKESPTCLLYIYYDNNMNTLTSTSEIYDSLSTCLKKRTDDDLVTKIFLPLSAKPTYDKINTYNAELIYY